MFALILGIALFKKTSKLKVSAYTYPYNYLSNVSEKDNIDIKILVNNKNSYFTNKDKINNGYISGKEGKIKLNIKEINIEKNPITIKDDKYYLFHFLFEIDLNVDSSFEIFIEKAYLYLNYSNDLSTNIYIGSFTYTKYNENNNHLSITSLKAINNKANIDGFYGCVMGIRNISNHDIIINGIDLLDGNINNIKYIQIDKIEDSTKYEDYFKNNNYLDTVTIEKDGIIYLAITFDANVKTMFSIEGIGIRIKNNENDYYLDKFIFYKVNNYDIKDFDFTIYEYK